MGTLGMIALGVFVGAVVGIALQHIKDWSNVGKLLAGILGATLGSTVFGAIEFLGNGAATSSPALYPLGLVLGLIWANADTVARNLTLPGKAERRVGWLHLLGLLAVTGFTLAVLLCPPFRRLLP